MVMIRESRYVHMPPPPYDPSSRSITVTIHYGGECVTVPECRYINGKVAKFDHFMIDVFNMRNLNCLCDSVRLDNPRKFYKKLKTSFKILSEDSELKRLCNLSAKDREVHIYVEANLLPEVEVGVTQETQSEPETQIETQITVFVPNNEWCDEENSNSDPSFDIGESCEDGDDDGLFQSFVDQEEEWVGNDEVDAGVPSANTSDGLGESTSEDEIVWDSDALLDSEANSDCEGTVAHAPVFNSKKKHQPRFQLGMKFKSKTELRKAIHAEAIQSMRNIKIKKNDKERVYAKCESQECGWKIHAYKVRDETTWQIQTYDPNHKCQAAFVVGNVTSSYLAERFANKLKTDPKRNIEGFRQELVEDCRVSVSWNQAYRAKRRALQLIEGDPKVQYAKLWDYAAELRRTNPNSTVILGMDDSSGENTFTHFYCCFGALKKGFLAGCRPILGVDGCHLSGPHKGVLLTAVGIDPNNKPYPVAYAVVNREAGDTWGWFLALIKQDLQITRPYEFTFISDKQKGLIQAMEEIFPESEHRFCVRHMWKNFMNAGWKGLEFKEVLWRAANSTTVGQFKKQMNEMTDLDPRAMDWLSDKPPAQWSKSHFNGLPKCDMVLNNFCESFNSAILYAREKNIITMLEWIREYMMSRLQKNRDKAEGWKCVLCPAIMEILNENIEKLGDCVPRKSDDLHYQITHIYGDQFCVDLELGSCTCRRWELTGIPCLHACCAICNQRQDPVTFVDKCYTVECYKKVYENAIMGINGMDLWGETIYIPPLPPNFAKLRGRPIKARRKGVDEPVLKGKKRGRGRTSQAGPQKMKRRQTTLKCSLCKETGHNLRKCPLKTSRQTDDVDITDLTLDTEELEDVFGTQASHSTRTKLNVKRNLFYNGIKSGEGPSKLKEKNTSRGEGKIDPKLGSQADVIEMNFTTGDGTAEQRRRSTSKAKTKMTVDDGVRRSPRLKKLRSDEGISGVRRSPRSKSVTNEAIKKVPGPSMYQQLRMSQSASNATTSQGKKMYVQLSNITQAMDNVNGKKKRKGKTTRGNQ